MNRSTGIIRLEVITNDYPGAFRPKGGYNDEPGYGQEADKPENEEDPDIDDPCKDHDRGNDAHPCCQDECCGLGFRGSHGYSMMRYRECNRFRVYPGILREKKGELLREENINP